MILKNNKKDVTVTVSQSKSPIKIKSMNQKKSPSPIRNNIKSRMESVQVNNLTLLNKKIADAPFS